MRQIQRRVVLLLCLMVLAGIPTKALAAEPGASGDRDVRSLGEVTLETGHSILERPCQPSSLDEIVVCGQRSGRSPYRLPSDELDGQRTTATGRAWGSRAFEFSDLSRSVDSNSPVGSGGQTGWRAELLRDWAAARREIAREKERARKR